VFDVTRRLCVEYDYRFREISRLSHALDHDLKVLSRNRHDLWKPDLNRLTEAVAGAGAGARTMSVRTIGQHLAGPGNLARGLGWVYWSIWHGVVQVDLERELSLGTRMTSTALVNA